MIAGSTFTDEELEAWTAAMKAGGSRAYEIAHGIGVHAYRAAPRDSEIKWIPDPGVRPVFAREAVVVVGDAAVDVLMGYRK